MNAVAFVQDRIAQSLAGNPDDHIQMGQHEEIVIELRTQITLLQKLHRRETEWRDAVTAWLLADREELVVSISGVPYLVHSLYESDDYARIRAAIVAVFESDCSNSTVVRYRCTWCKDIRCGHEDECASASDFDHILRTRMPKEVRRAAERVVEVRRLAGEVRNA